MLVALDKFGRLVLPKSIRDDLGLRPADKLEAIEKDDCIILRPIHRNEAIKSAGGVLVFSGRAENDLTSAVDGHARGHVGLSA